MQGKKFPRKAGLQLSMNGNEKAKRWCQTTGKAKGLQWATDAMLSERERERWLV